MSLDAGADQADDSTDPLLVPGLWRPLPEPSWLSAPFWDAAAEGRVRVQRCDDCRSYVFRPERFCTSCFGDSLTWTDVSDEGFIDSFSIVRRSAYAELPPVYAVVTVAMTEGWLMMSNLVDARVLEVRIGLPVRIRHVPFGDVHLPFVVPRRADVTPTGSSMSEHEGARL